MTGWLPENVTPPMLALLAGIGLIAGLSRGFSGFGAALIFVPMSSVLIGPRHAAAVLAIIDLIFASHLIPSGLRHANKREVGWMLLGALAGLPLGAAVLASFDQLVLRWMICIMSAAMLLLLLSGWRYRGVPHVAATVAVGAVSGLFSGIAQIGGPPVVSYWMGGETPLHKLRSNIVVYFAASSFITIAVYVTGHILNVDSLRLALFAGPSYGIGAWLGSRMFDLATPQVFRAITLALIAAAVAFSLPVHWS